jgi:hypothetical protein
MMSGCTHTIPSVWIDAPVIVLGGPITPRVELTVAIHIPNKVITVKRGKGIDGIMLWG